MDPVTAPLLSAGAQYGIGGLILVGAVLWLVRRDRLSDQRTDAMVARDRADALQREAKASEECLAREQRLAERLGVLEDRQHEQQRQLLADCSRALADNAAAFRAIAETPSGLHRLISGPRP